MRHRTLCHLTQQTCYSQTNVAPAKTMRNESNVSLMVMPFDMCFSES